MEDLESKKEFLRSLYNFSFIPFALYEGENCVFSLQNGEPIPVPKAIREQLRAATEGIAVKETVIQSYYASVPTETNDCFLIVGPVKADAYLSAELTSFMIHYGIEPGKWDLIRKQFQAVPSYSLLQFHHLLTHIGLFFCPDNKHINTYHEMGEGNLTDESYGKNKLSGYEEEKTMNLRAIRQVYEPLICEGNIEGLIERSKQQGPMYFGTYSTDAKKNQLVIAIMTITTSMMAALDGGMPDQEAYLLAKHYIALALKARTAAEIDELSMRCTMHLIEQVRKYKDAEIRESSLYDCVQFIRNKVYEPIKVSDVAKFSGYSETYFSKLFRQQMGVGAAEFIYDCKLMEAKSLLEATDQSLGHISESLYFSNQSHFQRKFKEKYGMSPLQYRNSRKRQKTE